MSNVKDYTKVFIIALLTTFGGQLIGKAFEKNDKIEDAATKTELTTATETVRNEAFEYTDKSLIEHEKHHLAEEKQRQERQVLMYKYLDDKFEGLEKLIDAKIK